MSQPTELSTHGSSGAAEPAGHGSDGHGHGSVALYVWIGAILAVLTFVEVAVYFMEALEAIEVPLLIILSTAKLILVVMFFMHLKMDHRSLTWLFLAGAVLAIFMVSALIVLYHVLPRFG
jgi:cytochrome c oxidase subunit IV